MATGAAAGPRGALAHPETKSRREASSGKAQAHRTPNGRRRSSDIRACEEIEDPEVDCRALPGEILARLWFAQSAWDGESWERSQTSLGDPERAPVCPTAASFSPFGVALSRRCGEPGAQREAAHHIVGDGKP